jgi:hypothetical protein
MTYSAHLKRLIGISTLLRLIIAGGTLLGTDEVYYFFYAEHLQWNYFDHPPGVAILIRLSTLNNLLTSEIFVRLGSVVCAAINTWLIFKITSRLHHERAGWLAALLYTASLYASIICGIFILPDSPQSVFWMLSLLLMQEIFFPTSPKVNFRNHFLLLGLCIGAAIMCKVHGVFLWGGAGLYILLFDRKWLKNPWLYVSAIVTAIVISPILIWNIQNDFITYRFHSERIEMGNHRLRWDTIGTEIAGEIFYNNPLAVICTWIGCIAWARSRQLRSSGKLKWILCMGLPIIVVLWVLSLKNPVLPHWSGPGYMTLLIAAAIWWSEKRKSGVPILIRIAVILVLVISIGGLLAINFYPGTLGSKKSENLGSDDFTLDMYGWNTLKPTMDSLYHADLNKHWIRENPFLLTNKWFPASHLDYYVARPLNWHLVATGPLDEIHHYDWLNKYRGYNPTGEDAYVIIPSNFKYDALKSFNGHYQAMDTAMIMPQYRSGAHVRNFYILRVHGYQ